ncbi:MAG TPA: hypothetical protein VFX36_03960 [Nitrospira sp.]|nr:hypothetical protein [Nitrospira sp.]
MGWWAIAAILLAAAGGLFGHGPLSQTLLEVSDPNEPARGMVLHYERFGRAHSESQILLSRPAWPHNGGTFSLWLSSDYLTHVEIVGITPEPATQEQVSNGVRYHFRLQDGPQTVVLRIKPEVPGRLSCSFRFNDGPPTTFHQWLFP